MKIDLGVRYNAVLHWKVLSSDSFEMHARSAPSLNMGDALAALRPGKISGCIGSLLDKGDANLGVQFQVPCLLHHSSDMLISLPFGPPCLQIFGAELGETAPRPAPILFQCHLLLLLCWGETTLGP